MARQTQDRQVGDTRTAIAATLKRPDNTVVNLTGLTVKFKLVDSEGTTKVAETTSNVTVDDAENGKVYYSPQSDDVDTEGTYYAYFIVVDGTKKDTFPANKGDFAIRIQGAV